MQWGTVFLPGPTDPGHSRRHPGWLRVGWIVLCAGFAATALGASPTSTPVPEEEPAFALDLPRILAERELRVLVYSRHDELGFPNTRTGSSNYERELVRRFADQYYLDPVFIQVERWDDLIPALLDGRGDVIATGLTVTESRKRRVAFTVPVHTARYKLVTRADDHIDSPEDLAGREVAMREYASIWQPIKRLGARLPTLRARKLPEDMPLHSMLFGVRNGTYDVVAVDASALESEPWTWPDLELLDGFNVDDAISWGVHPDAQQLLHALNRFLIKEKLAQRTQEIYREDLSGIKKRGVLRVLTRNNASTYFLYRGELMGFEYELLKRFAETQNLALEMIVPPSRQHLLPMLLWGGGDIVAASLPTTPSADNWGIAFTTPYNYVDEVVVARANDTDLRGPLDLEGRTVVLRRSSAHWDEMRRLRDSGIEFTLEAAPEEMETEEIIARVASGAVDLTVAYSNTLDVELAWRENLRAAFRLRGPVAHGWAVRADNRELLAALEAFIDQEYRGLHYNIVYDKYFRNSRQVSRHVEFRVDGEHGGALSPYDDIVREHAERHGFDWPLIVAQMYQESRFDPEAKSWAGAQGLMQLLPTTAERLGVTDLDDPEQAIEGGIRYLAWLYARFEPELSVRDRMWLALASYNAGLGHLRDARRLAAKLGLDPNQWFRNVEQAMLLLSKRKYYSQSRHGYVRGREPVSYVRSIRDRYNAYVQMVDVR